jgi:DNA polymerase-3 subunit alpha/error-prone DNA polymerase
LFSAEVQPSYLKINNGTAMLAPTQPISLKARKTSENELWEEYKSLGFLRRLHPLALWKDKVLAVRRIKARHIEEYTGRRVTLAGWPITQKEVWTKDGLTI